MLAAVLMVFLFITVPAAENTNVTSALSEKLQALLVKEMVLIDQGMGELTSAISAGDWKAVAGVASKIEGSFILKQSLSEEDVHQLHKALPDTFVEMDIAFHGRAGDLAHAAHTGDAEMAVYHYSRMLEGCVNCHARYAPASFPGLAVEEPAAHEH
jgi:hypothetical protein